MPPPSIPSARPNGTVAAFDFDKTLTTRDCVIPFLVRVTSLARIVRTVSDLPALSGAIVRKDRDRIKVVVTRRVMSGLHVRDIERCAETFAEHVESHWMRTDTLSRLRWHKAQGHRVGIVSASYAPYVRPIGERLGLDFVIATELEIDSEGRATGALLEGNCRGPEKARRLNDWITLNGMRDAELFAYGDSAGDRELLDMAHHAHLVGKTLLQ